MADWKLYTGDKVEPSKPDLPPPPPWRNFLGDKDESRRSVFLPSPETVEAVNVALTLRRPLLLTGRPGSGKSSLIESVAIELMLEPVLRWHITSRSTLGDALYRYDAIGRLHAQNLEDRATDIADFLRLGPLGTALAPNIHDNPPDVPRALLVDEIDKGDVDLPNDLLNIFERGEFEIPELRRLKVEQFRIRGDDAESEHDIRQGKVTCHEFPFVVLTSNGEREFPQAFLRRCIRHRMPDPDDPVLLARIVASHLGEDLARECSTLIEDFARRAAQSDAHATDQLLNAVFAVTRDHAPEGDEWDRVRELLFKRLTNDLP